MQWRQIIVVVLLLLSMIVMKSAFSVTYDVSDKALIAEGAVPALAALPADLLLVQNNVHANNDVLVRSDDVVVRSVPGSVVAIVVAALGLVSVARRAPS